ncbi:hypothetical protein FWP33_20445 [Vibrio parahaemolyticus]|nr:hypothetical protein [Vibrio parahaemolyticus]
MTSELETQPNQESESHSLPVFTPNVEEIVGVAYEQTQVRNGIKPISSIDLLDEPELQRYLLDLRSLSGSPEAKEIDDIQNANLVNNAKEGKEQRRLTHREIFKKIVIQKASSSIETPKASFFDKLPMVKALRHALSDRVKKTAEKKADSNFVAADLMLARDWRQIEHDLPPVDVEQSKEVRDQYYNFDTLYRQLILNLADYVGQLPASESHHHNWPGGLLKHSLEVALVSFKYSKSWDLPPISLNDYEARRRPRWQYAAFVIGLFHDVGKAITDMTIVCEDVNGNTYRWNPMLKSLSEFCVEKRIVRYFVDMNDSSKYMNSVGRFKKHEGMASALLDKMLTPECRHYLTSSPDPGFGLYEEVTSILSGKKGDDYLMRALEEGEKLSVHLSYKKIRSDFHLNNRNASVAELMMRELPFMTESENFMKNVFVVSGYVMLRYPEALNQLKQAVMNRSPETKAILNCTAMVLGKQLSSANFIRKVSNNNFLPRFAPTKAIVKRDKKTRENVTTYERSSGFFSVVILEHSTQLFGQKELPPAITGVLSLSVEHSLEFIGDDKVIEHTHEVEQEHSEEATVGSILDPDAKFNVVKQVRTRADAGDPDSVPGEKASEVSDSETALKKSGADTPVYQATSNPQFKGEQVTTVNARNDEKRSQSTSGEVSAHNHGNTSPRTGSPRQQAHMAAKKQVASREPVEQNSGIDVFSLDQPPQIVAEEKVYDAPETLLDGVNTTTPEVPKEKPVTKMSELLGQSGPIEKDVDSNVDAQPNSEPDGYPPFYEVEQVPIHAYDNVNMVQEQDDYRDTNYDDIYGLPEIEPSHDGFVPNENQRNTTEISVDIITQLYGEWVQISTKNKELFAKRSIGAMLFKAPFFIDNAERAGRKDWAVNGDHVERRNSRTVKLKQEFVDSVLAYVGASNPTNPNAAESDNDTPVKQNVSASKRDDLRKKTKPTHQNSDKVSKENNISEAQSSNDKTIKWRDLSESSERESTQPNQLVNPRTEKQPCELLVRLRNKVMGNPTLEGKFLTGRVPKVLFNSTTKSLGYKIEQFEEIGLVIKSDVRNIFIDVEVFNGTKYPKDEILISPTSENQVKSTASVDTLPLDEPSYQEPNEKLNKTGDKSIVPDPVSNATKDNVEPNDTTLFDNKTEEEQSVTIAGGVREVPSTNDTLKEKSPVHVVNDVHSVVDGGTSEVTDESVTVPQVNTRVGSNSISNDDEPDKILDEKVQQAMLRMLTDPTMQEHWPSSDKAQETKIKVGLNIQVDASQIDSMPKGQSPILMLLLHNIRKGEVYETEESKISRDNTTSVLLSDFLNQCRVFFESKRSTLKMLNKMTDEDLESIATTVWIQFAGQQNKVTVEITKN